MGKASSRKKLRREQGYTKRSLENLRFLVSEAEATGGMVKLTIGVDAQMRTHWVTFEAWSDPTPLCGEVVVDLQPTGAETITCEVCLAIPPATFDQACIIIEAENRGATARANHLLDLMGG